MSTHDITRELQHGATHRATAEAIYTHLRETPADLPNDDAREGHGHYKLILTFPDTAAKLAVGTMTSSWYTVFPDNVPWSEDRLSRGVTFTKDRLASNDPEDREHVIGFIRTALMRASRYATKQATRRAAMAEA